MGKNASNSIRFYFKDFNFVSVHRKTSNYSQLLCLDVHFITKAEIVLEKCETKNEMKVNSTIRLQAVVSLVLVCSLVKEVLTMCCWDMVHSYISI